MELRLVRECFLISLGAFVDCCYCLSGKETAMFTKVTKDWNLLAPLGPPFFASSFALP